MSDTSGKHILVPVDFSDETEPILYVAWSTAEAFGDSVTVLHVVPAEPSPADFDAGPQTVRDQAACDAKEAHEKARKFAEKLRGKGVTSRALVVQGDVPAEIIKHASRDHPRLIVMGTHGHGALYNALMGSVSEAVLRQAPCPVLFVPHRRSP